MNAIPIGLSTISSAQKAMDVIGQNIANSATPGYHRQVPALVDRVYDGVNGVGVEVKRVIRYVDDLLRRSILATTSDIGYARIRLDIEKQVETFFNAVGLDAKLSSFFDRVTQLEAKPDDLTLRRYVVAAVSELSDSLNVLAEQLTQIRRNIGRSIVQTVDDINRFTEEIASLNQQIARVQIIGHNANDLLNQRDQLIENLAELIDVRVVPQEFGQVNVYGGGTALVLNSTSAPLSVDLDINGNYFVYTSNPAQPLTIDNGKLSGLLREYNVALPGHASQLDELAVGIIRSLDGVQATGIDLNGPLLLALGHRGVDDPTVPLTASGIDIMPQAGDLHISITDLSTSQRTLLSVAIDPTTQSLQDIAAAITAVTGGQVQASIDPANNTLVLQASAGTAFDFAGRLPSVPDLVSMNGTSVPTVRGTYMGAANDVFSFQVVGSGTVGVSAGLSLEVRNGAGTLLRTLNIGAGYTPDAPLNVIDGILVSLSAGTTNNGSFSARVIAEPDEAGILTSLGINSLFTGTTAINIAVREELAQNPSLLSASRNGLAGDGRNLERMAALRDRLLLAGNTQTLHEFVRNVVGALGVETRAFDLQHQAANSFRDGLREQEQSVIGVDINEEMVKLMEFQRMFQAGVRYLTVVNEALDEVLNLVK